MSLLSTIILAYTSKLSSIINVDFKVVGYLLIGYSEYVSCLIKRNVGGQCVCFLITDLWLGNRCSEIFL